MVLGEEEEETADAEGGSAAEIDGAEEGVLALTESACVGRWEDR